MSSSTLRLEMTLKNPNPIPQRNKGKRKECRSNPLFILNYLKSGYMGEPIGILKVIVVRGKKLVIRDFKTSDPYVIVKLGNQTAKTKVINSCLNPVWNEELTFSIVEPVEVLKLSVFDKDRFKADDEMGDAEVNIQPLVKAARLKEILGVANEGTILRKVIPDTDNCLASESCISWVKGEVVQDVWLRLSQVESGDIQLKLKFLNVPAIPPPSNFKPLT
ncbi:hypothetical protein L6452_35201 [Arctium lappa]|uniref:Uncharacterized protein n=1 Tax=Arctium lappa TaxID=4217 RepID=A0ACB8Y6K1_ARCLA|nr:hypothetical protein L6452_35201 [Arctium lappa]